MFSPLFAPLRDDKNDVSIYSDSLVHGTVVSGLFWAEIGKVPRDYYCCVLQGAGSAFRRAPRGRGDIRAL